MARYYLFYGGSSVELLPGEALVGRDPHCRLRIHDPWVSRRHARFCVEGDELWVEDVGSRNGIRVNGVAIGGQTALDVGDEVELGSRRVTLQVHDDEPFEPDTDVGDAVANLGGPLDAEPPRDTQTLVELPELGADQRAGRSRRRHARHTLEVPVRYESDALQVEAVSVNLSASGVFIQTPILDEVGTRCSLTVLADESDTLKLLGEVRRVVDNPSAREPLGLGIEFSELEDGARRWLESTITAKVIASP